MTELLTMHCLHSAGLQFVLTIHDAQRQVLVLLSPASIGQKAQASRVL